jgi:hypothetical protein
MSKNIALFIDGTGNQYQGENEPTNTNVFKLYDSLANDRRQLACYLRGVGTDNGAAKAAGQVFGLGTADRIRETYRFLSGQYDRGDSVYLFGFSRGAFAARSLAGFVEAVGLLFRDRLKYVEEAYQLYMAGTDLDQSRLRRFIRDKTEDPTGVPVEEKTVLIIHFLGVWDTVGALGPHGPSKRLFEKYLRRHKVELPSNITHARHALALHELRKIFKPLLWKGRNPLNRNQSLEQVWFPGVHSNVGGGYKEVALSDISLEWMATEAAKHGLLLKPNQPIRDISKAAKSTPNNSIDSWFSGGWVPKVRKALVKRDRLEPQTRETLYVHQIACLRLLDPESRMYEKFPAKVRRRWKEIDEISLQLHLELSFQHGKFPIGMPHPNGKAPLADRDETEKSPWWTHVGLQDAAISRQVVDEFVKRPREAQCEEFQKSFCLLLLCAGSKFLDEFCGKIEEEAINGQTRCASTTGNDELRNVLSPGSERLLEIVKHLENCVSMLPPQWSNEVKNAFIRIKKTCEDFSNKVINELTDFTRGVGTHIRVHTSTHLSDPGSKAK